MKNESKRFFDEHMLPHAEASHDEIVMSVGGRADHGDIYVVAKPRLGKVAREVAKPKRPAQTRSIQTA